ncbi:Heparinase II/III-like protein [Opitutaceae bacterium TAV1]|nr:Heparinase II/III-like protein [Opitutaceae bacterium TAV1]
MKALTLLAFPLLLACPLAAQPLDFPNPGFEEGTDGFARWTAPAADKGMSTTSAEAARTGKLGLKVNDRSGSSGSSLYSTRMPVRPGRGYELSFSGRIVEGGGIGVYLQFFDTAGKLITPGDRFVISLRDPAGTWAQHTLPALTPEKSATAAVWVHSYNQATVTAHFDDFSLREISAADATAAIAARTAAATPSGSGTAKPGWTASADFLPDFPKPDPEKWHHETKLLQPDGSAFRAAREDWEAARRLVSGPAADPAWTAWLDAQRKTVDAWMARHRDRVEWRAGWWHDFVSPKDGSFLTWTDDIPGEQADHLFSPSDPRVPLTEKNIGGWIFGFRKRHIENTRDAARLYRLTDDKRYGDWAASQLDFYADNLQKWPVVKPKGNYTRLGCQSLEDATWLALFAETARLLRDTPAVPPSRWQSWYDGLFKPQVELLNRSFLIVHNIALWHRASSAQVALLYDDKPMWKHVVEDKYGLRDQLRRGVTSDYFWYEQSMGYNAYVVTAMQPLLAAAGLLGRVAELRDEAAIVQNLVIAPLTLRFPDRTIPNPADAGRPGHASARGLARIYRILPTAPGLATAAAPEDRNWDTLVDPPAAVAASLGVNLAVAGAGLPEPRSTSLASSRFAILKDGPWQVFFHYGQNARSHSQAEALNWSASFDGVDISHDPGTVGYGSPLSNGYYRRGLNHNVPLVNGEGQQSWHPGELLAFDPASGRATMSASQPQYRPGEAAARRTLRIEGDKLIDEATVTLVNADPAVTATLGLALHLQGSPRLPDSFVPVSNEAFTRNRPPAFGYWSDIRAATFENEAAFDVTFPATETTKTRTLRIRIATPRKFTLYQGSSPDYPPNRRAGFYIEKAEPAREASFVTELAPAAP